VVIDSLSSPTRPVSRLSGQINPSFSLAYGATRLSFRSAPHRRLRQTWLPNSPICPTPHPFRRPHLAPTVAGPRPLKPRPAPARPKANHRIPEPSPLPALNHWTPAALLPRESTPPTSPRTVWTRSLNARPAPLRLCFRRVAGQRLVLHLFRAFRRVGQRSASVRTRRPRAARPVSRPFRRPRQRSPSRPQPSSG
jgi:hypothetical protein